MLSIRLNDRIQEFDGNGAFVSKGGSKGTAEAQFNTPLESLLFLQQSRFFAGSITSQTASTVSLSLNILDTTDHPAIRVFSS